MDIEKKFNIVTYKDEMFAVIERTNFLSIIS